MSQKKLKIAVVGAGMGGLAVAATLRKVGIDVEVFEQASRFGRIGAGIQMMPNSMKVLRGIGVEERLRQVAFAPFSHLNRDGYTGELMRELPMPEALYGAPYLCMHRADLHDALASAVPSDIIHLNKKLTGLNQAGGVVTLKFADGTTATADAVVGAEGRACRREPVPALRPPQQERVPVEVVLDAGVLLRDHVDVLFFFFFFFEFFFLIID